MISQLNCPRAGQCDPIRPAFCSCMFQRGWSAIQRRFEPGSGGGIRGGPQLAGGRDLQDLLPQRDQTGRTRTYGRGQPV